MNTDEFRARAFANYRTGAFFNAVANAIRAGVTDDAELLRIGDAADEAFIVGVARRRNARAA